MAATVPGALAVSKGEAPFGAGQGTTTKLRVGARRERVRCKCEHNMRGRGHARGEGVSVDLGGFGVVPMWGWRLHDPKSVPHMGWFGGYWTAQTNALGIGVPVGEVFFVQGDAQAVYPNI